MFCWVGDESNNCETSLVRSSVSVRGLPDAPFGELRGVLHGKVKAASLAGVKCCEPPQRRSKRSAAALDSASKLRDVHFHDVPAITPQRLVGDDDLPRVRRGEDARPRPAAQHRLCVELQPAAPHELSQRAPDGVRMRVIENGERHMNHQDLGVVDERTSEVNEFPIGSRQRFEEN